MPFETETYLTNVQHYRANWEFADHVLYELVGGNGGHHAGPGLNAKLLIVGRSYATGIERQIQAEAGPGAVMSRLAAFMGEKAEQVAGLFAEIEGVQEPLHVDMLHTFVSVHGKLAKLLTAIANKKRSPRPRTFVAKYMHFHCPAVPIFDNACERVLKHCYHHGQYVRAFPLPPEADVRYYRYVLRFWQLYQDARAAGVEMTVRLLDYHLRRMV